MLNKKVMTELLQTGIKVVTFKKANGDLRVMKCTLNAKHLPPLPPADAAALSPVKAKAPNDDVIAVWSIDDGGWRSFRLDSVTTIEEN
tara:strand:+ start:39 stop:302 length:264 start_codon:yes stop_codon:yes gene_type:complete